MFMFGNSVLRTTILALYVQYELHRFTLKRPSTLGIYTTCDC